MADDMVTNGQVSFRKPEALTLREQQVGDVTVYRMDHPEIRMELNVMVGDILALAARATQTTIAYHQPEPGPLSEADKRLVGSLFLGAAEADTRVEGGDLTVLRDIAGVTEGALRYCERVLLVSAPSVVKHVAMVFGPGANGAIVGYMTGHANMAAVDRWKESVLDSLRLS